jgi:hypothetical protein
MRIESEKELFNPCDFYSEKELVTLNKKMIEINEQAYFDLIDKYGYWLRL